MTQDLAHLTSRILAFRDARNWRPFHTPKDLALALSIEAGELAELLLWKTEAEATGMAADPARRTAIADELADAAIYALLLADHYGIDLAEAVVDKIGKNEVRYPVERAKGNPREVLQLRHRTPRCVDRNNASECARSLLKPPHMVK